MALTDTHMVLLAWIARRPRTTIPDAAEALDLEASVVERLWSDLVDAGYIAPSATKN